MVYTQSHSPEGGRGGLALVLAYGWHRAVSVQHNSHKRGYLATQKGTLIKNYKSLVKDSLRFALATQPLAQYKIPLYSRMMALLVLLLHSGHTWLASGVNPT